MSTCRDCCETGRGVGARPKSPSRASSLPFRGSKPARGTEHDWRPASIERKESATLRELDGPNGCDADQNHSSCWVGLGARASQKKAERLDPARIAENTGEFWNPFSATPSAQHIGRRGTARWGEVTPTSRYLEARSVILMRRVSEPGSLTIGACSSVIRDLA